MIQIHLYERLNDIEISELIDKYMVAHTKYYGTRAGRDMDRICKLEDKLAEIYGVTLTIDTESRLVTFYYEDKTIVTQVKY